MTNELAAAVERLRMLRDGEAVPWYHDGGSFAQWKVYYDRETVAEAYLARESDDAKPVDREWLVSVLGVIGDSYVSDGGYEEGCCWKKHKAHDLPAIRYYGGLKAYYGQFADGRTPLATRGDVRAFMRLARWPANETNGGELTPRPSTLG